MIRSRWLCSAKDHRCCCCMVSTAAFWNTGAWLPCWPIVSAVHPRSVRFWFFAASPGPHLWPRGCVAASRCPAAEAASHRLAPVGVIGASMGGSVAVELARRHPERVASLLLLAPAGLTGRPMPVPPLLDRFGAWFLGPSWRAAGAVSPGFRRSRCGCRCSGGADRFAAPAMPRLGGGPGGLRSQRWFRRMWRSPALPATARDLGCGTIGFCVLR